jgi:hypothetical protein
MRGARKAGKDAGVAAGWKPALRAPIHSLPSANNRSAKNFSCARNPRTFDPGFGSRT